ncbi:MAG: hypothetical protein N2037_03885 [Acidimicrobiales bacterium]|nr:hypothetical protein [Acidimicrobiales bacterium]
MTTQMHQSEAKAQEAAALWLSSAHPAADRMMINRVAPLAVKLAANAWRAAIADMGTYLRMAITAKHRPGRHWSPSH